MAGRPIDPSDRRVLQKALASGFEDEPDDVRRRVGEAGERVQALSSVTGREAAERRSTWAWQELSGGGVLSSAELIERPSAPWARDDAEKLVLTEMDIEGWIFYASLCREVQGGGPLKMSVGDRLQAYRQVRERFEAAERDDQLAIVSIGAFWWDIRANWKAAPYERQQAWIREAPLPPPMTATSLGYLGAVLDSDLGEHADVLHRVLGPLRLNVPKARFR